MNKIINSNNGALKAYLNKEVKVSEYSNDYTICLEGKIIHSIEATTKGVSNQVKKWFIEMVIANNVNPSDTWKDILTQIDTIKFNGAQYR